MRASGIHRTHPGRRAATPPPPAPARDLGDEVLALVDAASHRVRVLAAVEARVRGDEEERRRFAAAAGRVAGRAGSGGLLAAVRNYVTDLWARANASGDATDRRKAMGILSGVAAEARMPRPR